MDEKSIEKSNEYMNDTLATFLTSSLNVELVHIILESITSKSGCKFAKDGLNHTHFLDTPEEFKVLYKIHLDTIKISDYKKWQVAKLPDFMIKDYEIETRGGTIRGNTLTSRNRTI